MTAPARLFPVAVRAVEDWPTNGHLIEAVVELGYLRAGDRVVDVTFGRGGWWTRWRPECLLAHDLHHLDGVDFRSLPYAAAEVDVVCFDPPYAEGRREGSASGVDDFLHRYGIDHRGPSTFEQLWALVAGGLVEAARVVRPGGLVLVKCMPYQSGKRFRPVPTMVTAFAEGLGLDLVDELVQRRNVGPGSWSSHNAARRNSSTLLVFRRRRRRPRSGTTAATLQLADLALEGRRAGALLGGVGR